MVSPNERNISGSIVNEITYTPEIQTDDPDPPLDFNNEDQMRHYIDELCEYSKGMIEVVKDTRMKGKNL